MNAQQVAEQLGGRRSGEGWMCRCVAHEDRTASLSLCDGKRGLLAHCHAGCPQPNVIAKLRELGLWPGRSRGRQGDSARFVPRLDVVREAKQERRRQAALSIWHAIGPGAGTHVETYLRARSIALEVPARLRYAASLAHRQPNNTERKTWWPCMVALVTDVRDRPVAIHRTYLQRDGLGKAPVTPAKMSLGPIAGAAVRLGPQAEQIIVAEGLETTLSAMQLLQLPAWAALSARGIETLELPREVRSVVIAADRDASGTGQRVARAAAVRWIREGRSVRAILPPPPHGDWNDFVRQHEVRA